MKLHYNDEESGIIPITGSPFTIFKVPKPPVTEKRAISPELIYKIFNHPDSESRKSTEFNRVNLARDCFMLSFALIGMNSADMYDCTQISAKSITYNRKKTRSRRDDNAKIVVDIQPEIKALIEKYRDQSGNRVFCFYQHYRDESTFNAAINKGLKKIIPELEFYSARHSWATIAVNDCGIDKYTVHSALNHIDDTMRVTDVYLKKNFKPINSANRKVLDFVLKQK
jgi:integrase